MSDAYKYFTSPKIDFTDSIKPRLSYNIHPKQYQIPFKTGTIRPARMRRERIPKLHSVYLKAGYGLYSTPILEAYVNNRWSRDYSIGAYATHYSSNGDIDNSFFFDDKFGVYGRKFFRKHTLSANLDYLLTKHHLYGYDTETSFAPGFVFDVEPKIVNQFNASANFASNFSKKSSIKYDLGADFFIYSDKYGTKENELTFYTNISKLIKSDTLVDIAIKTDFASHELDTNKFSSSLIYLMPKYIISRNDWKISVGANLINESGTLDKFHVYPDIRGSYKISGKYLQAYSGVTGNIQKNNLATLNSINPYLSYKLNTIKHTNVKMIFYAGLSGMLNSFTSFDAGFEYKNLNRIPFFINRYDTSLNSITSGFDVIYDNGSSTNFYGQLSYFQAGKFKFTLKGNYRTFDLKNEDKAWHYPSFKLDLIAKYNFANKITISSEIYFANKSYAKGLNPTDGEVELKGFVDANFDLEYKFSKAFSVFLTLKNVANKNYYIWNNYQAHGLNILGGLTVSF